MDGDLPMVKLSGTFHTRYSYELAFQCHRFEVNTMVRSEVTPVLLKSGQPVSQERTVEEMNERRSTVNPWC
ncbi:hypothetical protein F2Q70_00022423 [Brassica cretica]|uniref:Uncharacterized protein n=1 Tax=Brassica cretica TaxID=69181 RepID=A0A8S9GGI9_BRACR|nr:hypothetical protein F2Q70_00022423 [Brassica cretica]